MIIIWRGWGIIVPLIVTICLLVGAMVSAFSGSKTPPATTIIFAIALVISGAVIWFIARRIESRSARELVDKATGQLVTMRSSAGALFFVPTRYWAITLMVVGLLISGASVWSYWNFR